MKAKEKSSAQDARLRGTLPILDAAVTAVELARVAGVAASDVHYWGKAGFLSKREGTVSRFPLTEVPKAQLMAIFAKQLHMDAASAAKLATQLLPVYASRPNVVSVLRDLAEIVQSRIDTLARLLVDQDVMPSLAELLAKAEEDEVP